MGNASSRQCTVRMRSTRTIRTRKTKGRGASSHRPLGGPAMVNRESPPPPSGQRSTLFACHNDFGFFLSSSKSFYACPTIFTQRPNQEVSQGVALSAHNAHSKASNRAGPRAFHLWNRSRQPPVCPANPRLPGSTGLLISTQSLPTTTPPLTPW